MDILQIENLNFRYPGAERNAVDGVSFSVHSGEFMVVCGVSGCGKTTLLRLLKPELAPAGKLDGRIVYCGGERTPAQIGYVLQNPDNQIVTDKVWHELAFGLENLGLPTEVIRRRVGEMANYFGIQDWFRKKTDELSGGQKQRISIARVFLKNPPILLLDEATSALDNESEILVGQSLDKLAKGRTTLTIAHRLTTIKNADRILVLGKSGIEEEGRHEELLAKKGIYYRLWNGLVSGQTL